MLEQNLPVQPKIITSPGLVSRLAVDANVVGQTMADIGISEEVISTTSVYVDDSNHLSTNGIAYPKWLGRIRHFTNPELRRADGPIVRISSVVKGAERAEDDMNTTLVHELEHVAQMGRHDLNLKLGHMAIWGLAVAGGISANRLSNGRSRAARVAATLVGAGLGQQIGYKLAPHEVQARERSHTIITSAISRT